MESSTSGVRSNAGDTNEFGARENKEEEDSEESYEETDLASKSTANTASVDGGGAGNLVIQTGAGSRINVTQTTFPSHGGGSEIDEIASQATYLLQEFILYRLQKEEKDIPSPEKWITPPEECNVPKIDEWREIGRTLRMLAEEFERDSELQNLIDRIPSNCSVEAVLVAARVIFSDGIVNWGRIAGLFYFAFRMVAKAIDSMLATYLPNWIRQLIYEIVKLLVEKFAEWIVARGGWTAILESFHQTTSWQIGLFAALTIGFITIAIIYSQKKK